MTRFLSIILSLTLLIASGCARVQVSEDYDTQTRFPVLKSYGWKSVRPPESTDARLNNPLLHKRLRLAIDQALGNKGFSQNASPDFLVSYDFSIQTKLESSPVGTGFGFGYGSYRRFGRFGIDTYSDIRQYDVGTLVIDVYDAESGNVLWRGKGSKIYNNHQTPEENREMVNSLVTAILAQFPPQ